MQTVSLMSVFIVMTAVLLTNPPTADAVCCFYSTQHNSGEYFCADCTTATPYCAHGPCNIFGCNCDGGCRQGNCKKRSIGEEHTAESIVSAGDSNGDGILSIEEAETLLHPTPTEEHRRSVRSLDKNNDGMLTVDEIDN